MLPNNVITLSEDSGCTYPELFFADLFCIMLSLWCWQKIGLLNRMRGDEMSLVVWAPKQDNVLIFRFVLYISKPDNQGQMFPSYE